MRLVISDRMMELINKGGKTEALLDCLQIDVDAAIALKDTFEEKIVKDRFYAKRYFELVDSLKEIGIIK